MSHYDTLGVDPKATLQQIKQAYFEKALQLHPDINPGLEKDAGKFQEVSNAYEVLRDASKRAAYDAARAGLGKPDFGSSMGWKPSGAAPGSDPFEEAFQRWWREQGMGPEQEDPQMRREREAVDMRARAAAWEAEKLEALENKARMERMRQRAATAKAVRNAQTLARFWQTQGRLTWQDAAACSLFVASLAGLSQLWQ
ncbi:hypothetical protein WJX84_011324 [Apatococcus fuscideae]|uniref:J domain-containing protein n=1 Tax=Apatococcus fuscideae TaxID=2026836 RepID=A0AAW1TIN4_9CHLO